MESCPHVPINVSREQQAIQSSLTMCPDTYIPNFILKAVLEEEKRIIHALRRGVETQNYKSVKMLLVQAEQMGLSGEEVKQAQAMRMRIEV